MNEAEYYRRETRDSFRDIAQSRIDFAAEQIIDGFDGRDVSDALELAADKDTDTYLALCEALAHLQHIPISQIEDRRIRDLSIALDKVARFYAGHRAAQEVV
jgi:uncharacterized membrane protein